MGSWEGSCQVSGMSIRRGTPVVCLPIALIHDKWISCLPPIFGNYNDYGSLEKIKENKYTKYLTPIFKKGKYSTNHEKCESDCYKEPLPPDSKIWYRPRIVHSTKTPIDKLGIEDVMDLMERENCDGDVLWIEVSEYKQTWARLSMCLVYADVYSYMVSEGKKTINDFIKRFGKQTSKEENWSEESIKKILGQDLPENLINPYKHIPIRDLCREFNFHQLYTLNLDIETILKNTSKTMLNVFIDHFSFLNHLSTLRKELSLPIMAGSQDINHTTVSKFNRTVNAILKEIKKKEL